VWTIKQRQRAAGFSTSRSLSSQGEMMIVQAYTLRPVSTHLDGKLLLLKDAGGRWDAIQISVLPQAGTQDCTGWGLFPVLEDDRLGACELLTPDERVAMAALDALHGDD
jgi:hypothetical protein